MKGLIKEGNETVKCEASTERATRRLITAAQKVEHYEIATYGTLCTWASCSATGGADLLKQNLTKRSRPTRS